MLQSPSFRRASLVIALSAATSMLAACSGGSDFQSDYVSPIAATPAPQPSVPTPTGAPAPARRMPLLPPVPGDEASNGLPPIGMASLLPPRYN